MNKSLFLALCIFLCPLFLLAQTPDSSFGYNGNSLLYSPSSDPYAVINGGYLQASGRLLAGLNSVDEEGYSHTAAVVAFTPDGQTDLSFGRGDGTVILLGSTSGAYIAPQSNGKIVAVGIRSLFHSEAYYNVIVERLTKDGQRDSTFGINSSTILPTDFDLYQQVRCIAVDADDYIYIGGAFYTPTTGGHYFTILRFTPNGTLDSTFRVRHTAPYNQVCASLQILPDGSLIAGYLNDNHKTAAIVKYSHNGKQDSSFGRGGALPLQTNCTTTNFLNLKVAPNGAIVVATGNGKGVWLYKATAAGQPDNSFSGNGILYAGERIGLNPNYIIAVDEQSRILLPLSYNRIKRLAANGTTDSSFGTNGYLISSLADSLGSYNQLALISGNSFYGVGPYTDFTYSYVVASKYKSAAPARPLYAGKSAMALPAPAAAKNVVVYPNPAKSVLTVSGLQGQSALTVTDASGRVLLRVKTGDAVYRLPVAALKAGIYYLKSNEGVKVIPFVKE